MIVFTNGCFDIIHPGHVDLLSRAKALGNKLIVGINSDDSVRKIKGPDRPYFSQDERAAVLKALDAVDEVVIFDELTPEKLIHDIKPDVLVKGGDWAPEEIIGADHVASYGGKVYSLPLVDGFSSTNVIEKIRGGNASETITKTDENSIAQRSLSQHIEVFNQMSVETAGTIAECAQMIIDVFERGGKLLICGNGGSAADSQHLAAEFVGRYETERKALPAVALTTDTSAITALANDYDFERIFARQVDALAAEGDCLIAISTSGNSPNVIAAIMAARKLGCKVIGLTGGNGKKLASLCDACVMIPSTRTARIQEGHITTMHIWCEMVDAWVERNS